MKINITLTAIANAFALVNGANALTLDDTKATFGVPAARVPDANPRNTTLVLTGVEGSGYTGTKTVTYTRLGMGSGVAAPEFGFYTDGATTKPAFLTAAAVSLGLKESEVEITGELPAAEGETTTIVLSAKADSLLYVGSQDLTVEWPVGDVDLDGAITVADLDGFDPA